MRHCLEGKNLLSLFLQDSLAPASFAGGQLLRSGLFAGAMGVFGPVKRRSPTATPCVPRRLRTSIRSSSAEFPLGMPHCPSWLGWADSGNLDVHVITLARLVPAVDLDLYAH